MKQTNTRNQIKIILSMFALLVVASFFDKGSEWLKEIAETTLELLYFRLRLWFVPVAVLILAVGWLVLFRFMIAHQNKTVATLFLITGLCILFLPSIRVTFYAVTILAKIGISVNYFANSMLYYSSALVAANGLLGLLISANREQIE